MWKREQILVTSDYKIMYFQSCTMKPMMKSMCYVRAVYNKWNCTKLEWELKVRELPKLYHYLWWYWCLRDKYSGRALIYYFAFAFLFHSLVTSLILIRLVNAWLGLLCSYDTVTHLSNSELRYGESCRPDFLSGKNSFARLNNCRM